MNLTEHMIDRRTFLEAAGLAPLAAVEGPPRRALADTDPAVVGSWTEPFDVGGVAIHATLCHNDDVLIFQYVEGGATVDHTSWVGTWNWRTGVTTEAPFGYHRDIFCSAHNVLADGRVFIAGGHDHSTRENVGVTTTDVYDPITRVWTPAPELTEKRWYPTNVGLPDGRTLVFGGWARPGVGSSTVDEYDATTDSMRRLPPSATRPLGLYPRLHLMGNGKILHSGPQRQTHWFDPADSTWTDLARLRTGGRHHGAVSLLPGGLRALTTGGTTRSGLTATAEIINTAQGSPTWRYTTAMRHARKLHNTVVLPGGTVLVVGGGRAGKFDDPIRVPELFQPATGRWRAMAPQKASRMYHSTALLLPDGRVFSAGQDRGPLARSAELFSPPYLFRGRRPVVSDCSTRVPTGGEVRFRCKEAADLAKVVLIRPGSSTHQIDTDQRSIPLSFTVSGAKVTAKVPTDVDLVPPGYWMLFALNRDGVPSLAPWVRIG